MTLHRPSHRRTDPVAAHVYTLPIVREVPVGTGTGAPNGFAEPVVTIAGTQAW